MIDQMDKSEEDLVNKLADQRNDETPAGYPGVCSNTKKPERQREYDEQRK